MKIIAYKTNHFPPEESKPNQSCIDFQIFHNVDIMMRVVITNHDRELIRSNTNLAAKCISEILFKALATIPKNNPARELIIHAIGSTQAIAHCADSNPNSKPTDWKIIQKNFWPTSHNHQTGICHHCKNLTSLFYFSNQNESTVGFCSIQCARDT